MSINHVLIRSVFLLNVWIPLPAIGYVFFLTNLSSRLLERLKVCLRDRNLHEKFMPSFDWKAHGGR